MSTLAQAEAALRYQLERDAPERLAQAGAGWKEAPMGFYYGNTPHSEISVDMAVRASTLRLLRAENSGLPPKIWNGLVALINTNTIVAAAINTMRYATAHAVPLGPIG